MGSNVVYNEDTGKWVAKGSSDDTTNAPTSSNPNFGKSALEIRYDKNKREAIPRNPGETIYEYARRIANIRNAEARSANQTEIKEANFIAEGLKDQAVSMPEELSTLKKSGSGYQDTALKQSYKTQYKDIIEGTRYRPQPQPKPKEQIMEDRKQEFLAPPRKKEGSETIDKFDLYTYDPQREKELRQNWLLPTEKKATFLTSDPRAVKGKEILSGMKQGAINVYESLPYVGVLAVTSAVSPIAGGIVGVGMGGIYAFDVGKKVYFGEYQKNPSLIAETATEVGLFSAIGKGYAKGSEKVKTSIFEYKVKKSYQESMDPSWTWEGRKIDRVLPIGTEYKQAKILFGVEDPITGRALAFGQKSEIIIDTVKLSKPLPGYDVQSTKAGIWEYSTKERQTILSSKGKKVSDELFKQIMGREKRSSGELLPIDRYMDYYELGSVQYERGTITAIEREAKALDPFEIQKPLTEYGKYQPKTKFWEDLSLKQGYLYAQKELIELGLHNARSKPGIWKDKKAEILSESINTQRLYNLKPNVRAGARSEIRSDPIIETRSKSRQSNRIFLAASLRSKPLFDTEKNTIAAGSYKEYQGSMNRIRLISDIALDQRQNLLFDTKLGQDLGQRLNVKSISDVSLDMKQGLLQDTKQEQRYIPNRNIPRKITDIKIPDPIKPKRPIVPKILYNPKRSRAAGIPLFDVFVRRRGSFFRISDRPLSRSESLNLGAKITDKSIAATFRLGYSGSGKGREVMISDRIRKFRAKPGNIFIEKRKFRLDTKSELRGIKSKRVSIL